MIVDWCCITRDDSTKWLENALQDVTSQLAVISGPNRFPHIILLIKTIQSEGYNIWLFGANLQQLLMYY